jgi:iron(III) transport system substrate-binding protein
MTHRFKQAITVAAAALAATGALAACSSSTASTTSGGSQSITLYSGQHEQTADGLVTAFEKQTGITVNVRSDDEDTLANLIAVQGSHSPADVFYTENSPPLEFLQEKGLLSAVDTGTLAHTPSGFPPGSA